MLTIVSYWYLHSPSRFLNAFLSAFQSLEANLAVVDTAKNMDKPLFQDYTYQGRMIGVGIRLARILLGAFIYFWVAIAYAIAFLIWLVFPLLCLLSLVGSVLGNTPVSNPL